MKDLGLLILRLGLGGFLMGHGGQKLFGWFGGHGLNATGRWLESVGLRPGKPWAALAGGAELGGGLLTALGLAYPLGPLAVLGAMAMASVKAHSGRPIWGSEGGPEQPMTNAVIALALLVSGPGKLSLDAALGTRMSPIASSVTLLATVGMLAAGLSTQADRVAILQ